VVENIVNFSEFQTLIHENLVFVNFGIDNCQLCNQLKRKWNQLAKDSGELAVTQINCSDNVEICKEYKIYKYPSIQLFGDGKLIREYPDWMPRKSFHFKKFIEEAINPQLSFKDGEVIGLTTENFGRVIGKNQLTLVQFYTTVCWTCVHYIRSTMVELAQEVKSSYNGMVRIALFNCAKDQELCKRYGVKKFPTFSHSRVPN